MNAELLIAAVIGIIILAGLLVWRHARRVRLEQLFARAREPLGMGSPQGDDRQSPQGVDTALRPSGSDFFDAGALSSMSAAAFLADFATIDPQVLEAAGFAYTKADVESSWAFVRHIVADYMEKEPAGQAGEFFRLRGYVGELHAADQLRAAGRYVTQADIPNQPGWDLLVDGAMVDVKTTHRIGNVRASDENVMYLVPEDAAGETVADNVERLPGFSWEAADTQTSDAFLEGAGEAAVDGLALQLPVVAVLLTSAREFLAVRRGKDVTAAIEHGSIEATTRSLGVFGGMQAGAAVGSLAGPIGTGVGATLGAGIGAITTSPIAGYAKGRRVRKASQELERALAAYGAQCLEHLDDVIQMAERPLYRSASALEELRKKASSVQRSLRWNAWPSFSQVVAVEAACAGERRHEAVARDAGETVKLIESAADKGPASFGVLMLAAANPARDLGLPEEEAERARIDELRDRVGRERRNLAGHKEKRTPEEERVDPPDPD